MRCYLYDRDGVKRLLSFDATPICGVDFCDNCGDCLDCEAEGCPDDVACSWVVYLENAEDFLRQHRALPTRTINLIREAIKAN